MVLAVLALLTASAHAQLNDDARTLLQDVASSARSAATWRAEGTMVVEMTTSEIARRFEQSFRIEKQGPTLLRHEITSPAHTLQVCDGATLWTYYGTANFYTKGPADYARCSPPFLLHAESLADSLVSAAITGRDQVNGRDCEVVRAEYPLTVRIFCIDSARKLVLREWRRDALPQSTTITYTKIERDVPLDPAVFQFQPPPGSYLNNTMQPPVERPIHPLAGGSAPTLIQRVEPDYSEEARQAKYQGTVLVSVDVGTDGVPRNVRVIRGLGLGLDEKAMEAVRQWRFKPGMRDGQPVVTPATIEVNFRLK
jgi:TonB family protein